jgi:hypothetical protein
MPLQEFYSGITKLNWREMFCDFNLQSFNRKKALRDRVFL